MTNTIDKNKYINDKRAQSNEMVIQFMPAVRAMAYRLKERLPASVDVNDLISIGIEEMIKLSRRYDKDLNDSFWGYAKKRVYGSMLDYLRSLDVVSRSNRRLIKAIDVEITKYLTDHDHEPDDKYLAVVLDESVAKVREARAAAEIAANMPLNEQMISNSQTDTEEKIEKDELVELVKNVLNTLSDREQIIIQLYYFEELNLKEISQILEISESRISQIHKKLLRIIRQKLGNSHG